MTGRLATLAALAAAIAGAPAQSGEFSVSGRLDLEWAVGTRDGRSQKLEAVLRPELEWRIAPDWRVVAIGRARADAFDRMEPGRGRPPETSSLSRRYFIGSHVDLELRELRLETQLGPAYLTLGKQQIVWGQADGLKVLDVVNPQSFREFILDDFEDSRIPLWAVNAEVPIGPVMAQLLWIPDPSFHELPAPDAVFALTAPRFLPPAVPGFALVLEDVDRPRRIGADGDAGLRLSTFAAGFDLAFHYLYQYDNRPVFDGRRGLSPLGPTLTFTPRYERTHLVGASGSSAFGSLTVRFELAFSSHRFLSTTDPREADALVRTPELGWVVGLDYFGLRDTLVSLQVFQSALLRDHPGLLEDRFETFLTLLVRHELWNERLRLEGIWIHGANDGDGILRPRATYQVASDLSVWAGLDLFYGRARGPFGQFSRRDRVVVGMRWGF
jgi:hypothetical protein